MICKNIVKKFVAITLILKELMTLLRGKIVILLNKITKLVPINILIYIYIYIFKSFRGAITPANI